MNDTQKRADAVKGARNANDVYNATVDSIEPNIAAIDSGAFYASAAISLKRIADVSELFAISLIKEYKAKDANMRDWAHRHGFGDLWDKAQ